MADEIYNMVMRGTDGSPVGVVVTAPELARLYRTISDHLRGSGGGQFELHPCSACNVFSSAVVCRPCIDKEKGARP